MATTAFNPSDYLLRRARVRTLPAGTRLAHCHRSNPATGEYPFDAFNPLADTRFAGVLMVPRRGGYYAGTTAAGALWESDLRNVVGDELGYVAFMPHQFRHRRLSFVRTTRDLRVLDVMPSALAGMVSDKAIQHRWTGLTTIDQHGPTHAPTAALLAQLDGWGESVDGFAWYSRQCGTLNERPIVYGFFHPPATPSAFALDPDRPAIDLDSAAGLHEIDQALALAHLARVRSGAAVGAWLAPPAAEDEA